jgi:hypothetical protein
MVLGGRVLLDGITLLIEKFISDDVQIHQRRVIGWRAWGVVSRPVRLTGLSGLFIVGR